MILPKLVALAKHGQRAHSNYLKQLNQHPAQCTVPVASDIAPLPFEESPGCFARYDCSVPEY